MARSRTHSFRRSVVQVAAAFAVLPACGTELNGTGNHPPPCDEQAAEGCMPALECTETAPPEQGAACAVEGQRCTYDSCTTPGNVGDAECVNGHWKLGETSCNPPELPFFECPAEPPQAGDACEGPLDCDYDSCTNAEGVGAARCVDGVWEVGVASCNPPPPPDDSCPLEAPEYGTPCSGELECGYEPCANGEVGGARCVNGSWELDISSCNPPPYFECPETQPEEGAACEDSSAYCVYGSCLEFEATCIESRWTISELSCNPPEFFCPEQLPADDSACPVEGQSCAYGDDASVVASCSDGSWKVLCDGSECQEPHEDGCPIVPPTLGEPCQHVGESCGYNTCGVPDSLLADCVNGSWQLSEQPCHPPPLYP